MWRSVSLALFLVTLVTCDPVDRCPPEVKGIYGGSEGRYIADDRNQSVYYKCIDGFAYQYFCDEGLYFGISRGSCMTAAYTLSPPQVPTLQYEGAVDSNQGPVWDPISNKGRCLGTCPTEYTDEPVKHLPHAYDCTLFCKCARGKPVPFVCPDGLYFNPILEVCDWPAHSRCTNKQPQPL